MTKNPSDLAKSPTLLCIDLGTTTTRVWRITPQGQVLTSHQAPVGVRDSSREKSSVILHKTLHTLVAQASAPLGDNYLPPAAVIAAGMITSSLGLREVPHISAPADRIALANALECASFPEITSLPFYFVPGVRCGPCRITDPADASAIDLMRGEETLSIGLHQLGLAAGGATLLNFGSHWKAISISATGSILSSSTSLSGEMLHAIYERTILHDALPPDRPHHWDPLWLKAGMAETRTSGLARTLFIVRILQLQQETDSLQRQAYFTGAFIAADTERICSILTQNHHPHLLIAGHSALADAWQIALQDLGLTSIILPPQTIEAAMLTGLCEIYAAAKL
jgi:2-dehydro-3-deoxygalactonokinase